LSFLLFQMTTIITSKRRGLVRPSPRLIETLLEAHNGGWRAFCIASLLQLAALRETPVKTL